MMISASQFIQLVADNFTGGDTYVAGVLIFAVVMALIIAIVSGYSMTAALISILPVALIFGLMGILTTDLMILILIVAILGLALYSKVTISWDPLEGRDRWGRRR